MGVLLKCLSAAPSLHIARTFTKKVSVSSTLESVILCQVHSLPAVQSYHEEHEIKEYEHYFQLSHMFFSLQLDRQKCRID